jgi:hypothetical protein
MLQYNLKVHFVLTEQHVAEYLLPLSRNAMLP